MEQKQMLKQMVEFNQAAFNNTFKAMEMMQDQFERVARSVMEQATWLPAEGRNAIENWVQAYKGGREKYKQYLDESYGQVEKFFQ
ncbi:MAG: hypothetical protein VR64_10305 [Desulfatitalea sp. BRH_c12]|nr:MAG: hypothetical protein VR64_10305 [Desulfatitalea sp. BRH_c12]